MAATCSYLQASRLAPPEAEVLAGAALLREARGGDRDALARLIMPHAPALYRSALRLTRNPADAEDVQQESITKAIFRLEQFAGAQGEAPGNLQAWVSRIGVNASIDVIRKRREGRVRSLEERNAWSEETLGERIEASQDNPEERFARREMRKLFADAIARLAPDLRQACLLRDVLQYTTQEVADRLGISTMAVRLRLFRAHRKLREMLSATLRPKMPLRTSTQARTPSSRQVSERQYEPRIPMAAFSECPCGD